LSGLTGVAFIQLTGGSPDSAPLVPEPGRDYAVIKAAPSSLQDLLRSGPETLQNANELIKELKKVVLDNQTSVSETLANINTMSQVLADNSEDVRVALKQLSEASRHLNSISRSADDLMKDDVKDFIADAREAARSYRDVAVELDRILEQSGPGIGSSLAQLPQLVEETRALVASLDRIASRAEDDPARFFVGKNVPEVEARP